MNFRVRFTDNVWQRLIVHIYILFYSAIATNDFFEKSVFNLIDLYICTAQHESRIHDNITEKKNNKVTLIINWIACIIQYLVYFPEIVDVESAKKLIHCAFTFGENKHVSDDMQEKVIKL